MIDALAAVGAGAGYGTANFLGGLAARRQPVLVTLLVSQAAALLLVTAAAVAVPASSAALPVGSMVVGGVAGLTAFAGAYLAHQCFRSAQLGVSAVLLGAAQLAVPAAVGGLSGAAVSSWGWAGLGSAAAAVVVLGLPGRGRERTGPLAAALAVAAGAAFGGYHSIMANAPQREGLWAVAAAEAVIVVLAAVAVLARRRWPAQAGAARLAVGDGLASAAATVTGLIAVRGASLPVAGALIAVVPAAVTVLLARVVLGQRLPARSRVGVALGGAAVVLLAVPGPG